MLTIGITGGIGSGKSTVCRLFEQKGVPVFSADAVAKELTNGPLLPEIISAFGPSIVTPQGALDRGALAAIVFADPQQLEQLNAIVHPRVFDAFRQWEGEQNGPAPYRLAEAALMFESGMFELVPYVLSVTAEDAVRITRVIARDGITEEQVRARIAQQATPEQLSELSDFQIANNGTLAELSARVDFFHILFSTLQPPKEIV